MKIDKASKALQDVWKWKDACYREVAHLPFRDALRKRIQDSERAARELGFMPVEQADRPHLAVAEDRPNYGE
jgi:hypothetical protein